MDAANGPSPVYAKAEPELCKRCRLPIIDTRYDLRLQADGPGARTSEFTLCKSCLVSFQRWLGRLNQGKDVTGLTGETVPDRGGFRTRFERELSNAETGTRFRSLVATGFALLVLLVTAGLLVYIYFGSVGFTNDGPIYVPD